MPSELDGLAYSIHYESATQSSIIAPTPTEWSANVEVAASGRGRIDVLKSTISRLFDAGDFVLFDSDGSIIVKPALGTFDIPALKRRTTARAKEFESSFSFRDLVSHLETLPDREAVAGFETIHTRLTVSYGLGLHFLPEEDMPAELIPQPTSTLTREFWVARVEGLPPNPMSPFGPMAGADALPGAAEFKAIFESAWNEISQLGVPLRSRTRSESRIGDRLQSISSDSDVSLIRAKAIDPARLMLPEGIRWGGSDTDDIERIDALVAKWRTPPAA